MHRNEDAPVTESPLGEVLDFMRLMWAVDHGLHSASKRMKVSIGVTGPQRLVVRIVARFPGIPPGRIAELLHLHPSTLTGIVQRLIRQGILQRQPDPSDGRRALLSLTAKGRRVDAAVAGTIAATVERVLARTPRARLASTRRLLGELAEALNRLD